MIQYTIPEYILHQNKISAGRTTYGCKCRQSFRASQCKIKPTTIRAVVGLTIQIPLLNCSAGVEGTNASTDLSLRDYTLPKRYLHFVTRITLSHKIFAKNRLECGTKGRKAFVWRFKIRQNRWSRSGMIGQVGDTPVFFTITACQLSASSLATQLPIRREKR